ncbi:MAG: glycosyltransferase family 39 protein [Chloroflexota bacterium]|nr:glycosyltransferase family 39 protein [Chloroflexota bacterium]
MSGIIEKLRGQLQPLVLLVILTVLMTFPTVVYVFNTEVFWLPTGEHSDTWMKFWDAWYGWRVLAGEADIRHTPLLFSPQGLSLRFHSFSLTHILAFGGLQRIMPPSNAYSLVYLLIILAVSSSAYLYLRYLFKDRRVALLGAVIVGMSPFVIGHPQHPDLSFIATIPLSLYFLHRGLLERRNRFIAASAALTGITAYIGMYIFVCLCLTVCMVLLYFAALRGRDVKFWIALAILALIVGGALAPRLYAVVYNRQYFDEAIEKWQGSNRGGDLVEYLVNTRHPVLEPVFRQLFQLDRSSLVLLNTSYLSYTILILIAIGFARGRYRRQMIPWLVLLFPFLMLRLGSVLTINGREYAETLLPKRILDDLAPGVFQAFHTVDHFQMGLLVPLAVLACYGALTVIDGLPARRRRAVLALCIALVAFEYYQPVEERIVPDEQLAFLDILEAEPGPVGTINAPMGRGNSKHYLFYQALSGHPQVEGLVSRTPPSAYNYIRSNRILNQWLLNRDVICVDDDMNGFGLAVEDYLAAIDQLEADGFSHVVFHRDLGHGFSIRKSFYAAEPTYSDDYVSIYRLDDLRASCQVGSSWWAQAG